MNMALNRQPRERRTGAEDNGSSVDIVGVWETLQGEGPFAGTPCVFIRTAGCNLVCPACDTDYTSRREHVSLSNIISRVKNTRDKKGLVVITGGEPFRQNIEPLISELILGGWRVQIETNGTYFLSQLFSSGHKHSRLSIVCSPKAPSIHEGLKPHVDALKYVVAANCISEHDGLPTRVLGSPYSIARPWEGFKGDIFLQPEDHQDPYENKRNQQAALASCFKYGYRFCLQQHKILGLE